MNKLLKTINESTDVSTYTPLNGIEYLVVSATEDYDNYDCTLNASEARELVDIINKWLNCVNDIESLDENESGDDRVVHTAFGPLTRDDEDWFFSPND